MPKTTPKQRYDLRDSPFFNLKSRKKLAELLQTSTRTLAQLSVSSELYSRCWKHKLSDVWLKSAPPPIQTESYRPIDIPIPRLKKIQSRVANLLARIQTPNFLFSPVKGRSYVDNAAHHIGSNAFWLLDVADYFPSCSANNVARFFRRDLSCSPDVTAILVRLITLGGCLPQGSPCSPILAYYCNRPMWLAIECQTKTADCKLSLYADDITISGGIVPKKLIWEIKKNYSRKWTSPQTVKRGQSYQSTCRYYRGDRKERQDTYTKSSTKETSRIKTRACHYKKFAPANTAKKPDCWESCTTSPSRAGLPARTSRVMSPTLKNRRTILVHTGIILKWARRFPMRWRPVRRVCLCWSLLPRPRVAISPVRLSELHTRICSIFVLDISFQLVY